MMTMLFDIWMADGRRYRRSRTIVRRPLARRPAVTAGDDSPTSIDPWA